MDNMNLTYNISLPKTSQIQSDMILTTIGMSNLPNVIEDNLKYLLY